MYSRIIHALLELVFPNCSQLFPIVAGVFSQFLHLRRYLGKLFHFALRKRPHKLQRVWCAEAEMESSPSSQSHVPAASPSSFPSRSVPETTVAWMASVLHFSVELTPVIICLLASHVHLPEALPQWQPRGFGNI